MNSKFSRQNRPPIFNEIEVKSSPVQKLTQNITPASTKSLKSRFRDYQYESLAEKRNKFSSNLMKNNFSNKNNHATSHSIEERVDRLKAKQFLRGETSLDRLNNSFQEKNPLSKEFSHTPKAAEVHNTFSPKNFSSDLTKKQNSNSDFTLQFTPGIKSFQNSKFSVKSHGVVRGYAANTNQGIVR